MKIKNKRITALICATALTVSMTGIFPESKTSAENGGVVLNEICAKNTKFASNDGKCYDWIELYNSSDVNINLSGYGLTDKSSKPYKLKIPEGTIIEPNSHLLIFCDATAVSSTGELFAPFGLSASGETVILTDTLGKTVDNITFGAIDSDASYGRYPDGSSSFAVMQTSPDSANIKPSVDVAEPTFSANGGFYDNPFDLTINAKDGLTVYYTTDGSDPMVSDTAYVSQISVHDKTNDSNVLSARTDISADKVTAPYTKVDKAMIVRAVAVDTDGNTSDIVTNTYFIGYNSSSEYYDNMTVISLVTDPDNLFDYDKGLYVQGATYDNWKNSSEYDSSTPNWEIPGNYFESGSEWERNATVQIFNNTELALTQNVGIRIHGGATRSHAQKSIRLYARNDYGKNSMDYDFFTDLKSEYNGNDIENFSTLLLRNGGNDNFFSYFRDNINQSLVADRNIGNQASKPCILFLDGEYWGLYSLTERLDPNYVESHYGVNNNDVAIIKNNELDEGTSSDLGDYNELYEWVKTADMSIKSNYEQFCRQVDIDNFINYIASEVYIGNEDWVYNNWMMWRSNKIDASNKYADGKWRFLLFDTEFSANIYENTTYDVNTFNNLTTYDAFLKEAFSSLLKNNTFREKFSITFMDIANENFTTDKVSSTVSSYLDTYQQQIYDSWKRFYSYSDYYAKSVLAQSKSGINSYYKLRKSFISTKLGETFKLKGTLANINLENDDIAGDITLNTTNPTFSSGKWQGQYYTDYPVTVSAEPLSGHKFSHWEITGGTLESGELTSETVSVSFNSDITIKAVYDEATNIKGDVNNDGNVDSLDLALLKIYFLYDAEFYERCDINSDSVINNEDIIELKKILIIYNN